MTEQDKIYVAQMESWLKEQESREKAIRSTIETSGEIVKQNEIQLEWHLKGQELAVKEYKKWLADKEVDAVTLK